MACFLNYFQILVVLGVRSFGHSSFGHSVVRSFERTLVAIERTLVAFERTFAAAVRPKLAWLAQPGLVGHLTRRPGAKPGWDRRQQVFFRNRRVFFRSRQVFFRTQLVYCLNEAVFYLVFDVGQGVMMDICRQKHTIPKIKISGRNVDRGGKRPPLQYPSGVSCSFVFVIFKFVFGIPVFVIDDCVPFVWPF